MSIWTDKEGRIHVAVMVGGKRIHRRMSEAASKSDAKLVEADLRKSLGSRVVNIPGDPLMQEVMGLYMAHAETLRSPETAKHHALRAGPWLLNVRASEAQQAADKMVRDMRKHYAPATINRSLGAVKSALTLAYRQGLIHADHGDRIRRLPENNARHSYLTTDEVKLLAAEASEQVRAAIWIALLTGCRRGEILALTVIDIGKDSLTIRAGNTKTLKQRTVPIVPALRPWLKYIPLQINFEGLKTGFRRAREKAGMPDIRFHDLRRSCATIMIQSGAPLHIVSKVLGHSSTSVTEKVYAHLSIDQQSDSMRKAFVGLEVRKRVKKA